ncbi:MAG: glycosyltransferase [Methanomethylovorans sp.]|uniref:glycosyltransferase n=1 Tax=Methanomethylovorans sp. TaxID=2758717 RepID=UPI000AAB83A4|nr:glycosyltransferase [Methanomethylovorans sp.]
MKIAIFHDYIGTIGGGEKLVLTLAKGLGADVITTDVDMDSVIKMGFENINIISLGKTLKIPPLKQISASFKFAACDFSKNYDFFIFSGNWAFFAAKKHKSNIYYCHTPTRAFYDLYDVYRKKQSLFVSLPFVAWVHMHSKISEHYLTYVSSIVTNSMNTQKRIQKYFGRDSVIVYPPIDTSRFEFKGYGDFWLSVNRLYPEKRIELQIDAFREMPDQKLVIVGGYASGDHASGYATKLIARVPENVTLIGSVSEEKLLELYATCKGHITTALDEDFGMTPVEAMAAGKPTVAVKEGGYLETILDGVTGFLVEPDVPSIVKAVKEVSLNPHHYREACIKRSKEFDVSVMLQKMRTMLAP